MPEGLPSGVRAALRRQFGCGERVGLRLTRDERQDCDERLGRRAAAAPYIPAPIEPEIRAYYDAVAVAKAPDPTSGHGPRLDCHIDFGPGVFKVRHPPHGLRLGPLPCFVTPPAGSLSPDVDVQNPDQVVRERKPR